MAALPRVRLRPLLGDDIEAWSALIARNRQWLSGWISLPREVDDPGARGLFAATLQASASERFEKRAIEFQGALIGVLNFNEIVRGAFCSAYVGYWIDHEHAGQGLMSEALGLGLRWAFEDLGLHRLEANLQPENTASQRLVKRAGFVREGFSERYLKVDGRWRDHERWAITVERWRGAT